MSTNWPMAVRWNLNMGLPAISLMGEETVTPIIFGPEGSEPILGVLALEGLGISVDPKTRSLKRERARSLKCAVTRKSTDPIGPPAVSLSNRSALARLE